MSHPTREQWMDFLYEGLDPAEKSRLAGHLKSCPACERQIASWRGAMTALDQWALPATPRWRARQPWIRWAAAAAILLAAGVVIGKATQSSPDKSELQALRKEVAAQRQLMDDVARRIAENRARDRETMVATLRQIESRRAADLQNLRRDLETVATVAQEGFNDTESQLVRLASYTGAGAR